MRWILVFLFCSHFAFAALAQGQIDFRNDVLGQPVFSILDTTTKLYDPARAQLYAGPDGSSALAPLGAPAPFGLGARAGYWDPSPDAIRVVPGVAPGDYATVVVVAWVPRPGCETFECTRDSSGIIQFTYPLRLQLGGNDLPPATLSGMYWVPEPSPTKLGLLTLGLWAGHVCWRRRRAA